ncbi:MAG: 16S rRNA (adenine(1518)-N(6)/adenine(1519)-N(6))-dimethyltransferase RsmA [Verrucomicrobiae bacterium]|nr:16S rRNA (adenine(1518)-N(6)/adenine(1519)-N(6))-dimethyltransferase RsmA [Verrucomicrobiae bacterium]
MTISEIKKLLIEYDIHLTKQLGQNFLHDANQLKKILSLAQIQPQDKVIEIGPGLGPLTELLLPTAKKILAIEKDEKLVEILKKRFATANNLEIVNADALIYLKTSGQDWSDWIVVSNLPYSVASPILVEFSKNKTPPKKIVVTVQLEVAQRLMAHHSTEEYGALTLLLQIQYKPVDYFKIPSSCFFPEPKVDSACVKFIQRETKLLNDTQRELFYKIVNRAFSQRRKMMFKLLKQDFNEEKLHSAFNTLGIPQTARGESVSLEQYVELAKTLWNRGDKQQTSEN